jgi:two-component system sensor histidine kinase YesM
MEGPFERKFRAWHESAALGFPPTECIQLAVNFVPGTKFIFGVSFRAWHEYNGGMAKHSISMRKKLFLIMLAVSIVPTIIITIFATVSTYRRLYQDTITINTEGMNQSHQLLQRYTEDMKKIFYAMEFDPDYKQAVIDWSIGEDTYQDISSISDRMVTNLNRNNFLLSLQLFIPDVVQNMLVERAGVRIETTGTPTGIRFPREQNMQTNIFFKQWDGELFAIHNIHRFEDRALIAQLIAGLRQQSLATIVSPIRIYGNERILILNDEAQVLISIQKEGVGTQLSPTEINNIGMQPGARQIGQVWYMETGGELVFSSYALDEKLSVVKIVPKQDIIRSVLPTVYTGIIVGIASAFGAIILSIILSRFMSRPVERLAQRVKNIEMQSLILEADEEGGDEVSVLEHHISLFVSRIRTLIKEEYEAKLQARTAQFKALQAQINPHFLHNTLQLIGSISLAKDVPQVYRVSTSLSNLMRYSMDMERMYVTLEEELVNLENFFFIQKQRFSDRFSVEMDIHPEVRDCLVPRLLIQPIVENAFTHGFSRSEGSWKLRIVAESVEPGKVRVAVWDNGLGMDEATVARLNSSMREHTLQTAQEGDTQAVFQQAQHIGLLNVHDRIRLSFSSTDGLSLRSEQGKWTEVELLFDARRNLV